VNRYRAMSWPVCGHVLSVALACLGIASTVQAAGLVGNVTSQTFTPKSGTTPAKLEQTLLVSDDLPNNDGVFTWITSTSALLSDFLKVGDGDYFLDYTLHVRNALSGPPPGLAFSQVGIELRDVAGLPFNGTDRLFFGAGPNVESTSCFLNPPTADGTPPEVLTWKNGLLPASDPYTEATFKMLIQLDATENFGGNGQATFSMDTALTVQTVPEPSSIILAILGLAGGGFFVRRQVKKGQSTNFKDRSCAIQTPA
jgi:hypothetical protein